MSHQHAFEHRLSADRAEPPEGSGAFGQPSEQDLSAINSRVALTPQRAEDLFAWGFVISNSRVDSHGTWMDASSLRNYERQANGPRGIPYLRNHDTYRDEMGRVFSGELRDLGDYSPARPPAGALPTARDAFREPGQDLQLVERAFTRREIAPDMIARLESGISASNSIGFSVYTPAAPGSMLECDICQVDLFLIENGSWICPHIPGVAYEVKREEKTHHVIATARVVNATQREASGVYLGSTPGTYTLADRAASLFRAGQVSERDARLYEEMHRLTRGYVTGQTSAIFDLGRTKHTDESPTADGRGEPSAAPPHQELEYPMNELVSRVRELLGSDPDRVAAYELAGGDRDPAAALHRVLTDEAAAARQAKADAEARADATLRQVQARLEAQDGEPLAATLDRVMTLAALGRGAHGRLVDELLRQMTRAGLKLDDEATAAQRKLAERLSPEEVERQINLFKATADAAITPGRTSDPVVESRGTVPEGRPDPASVR